MPNNPTTLSAVKPPLLAYALRGLRVMGKTTGERTGTYAACSAETDRVMGLFAGVAS